MAELRKISVVTSLYRSETFIRDFYQRHLACIKKIGIDYEFVFVDDASPDNSISVVKELIKSDSKIRLVCLSRNFGQSAAMFAAMSEAKGDLVYTVDSDLEETPENIIKMYDVISKDKDIDMVYGVAQIREGGLVRAKLGKIFYLIMDLLSTIKIPHDQTWQRIMNRKYVDSLLLHQESETLILGLMILTGFKQVPIAVEKSFKGFSSYSLRKRAILALDGLLSFSPRPALLICLSGTMLSVVSFLAIAVLAIEKIYNGKYQTGWLSVIASIWFVGGILQTSIGVIGIYVVKIFNQVKGRPKYIIKSSQ